MSQQKPHTIGGCDRCLGVLTIDGNTVTHNPAYYIVASASKFVRPGSVRIASSLAPNLPNVAFKTPGADSSERAGGFGEKVRLVSYDFRPSFSDRPFINIEKGQNMADTMALFQLGLPGAASAFPQ
ncbi:hypothetical protein GCM10028804_41750 [Larkinella terrae]